MTEFPGAQIELYKASQARGAPDGLHVAIVAAGGSGGGEGGRGADAVRRMIGIAADIGITHLTVFASQSVEHSALPSMTALVCHYLEHHAADLEENGVRFAAIGAREDLPPNVATLIAEAERRTEANRRLHLTVALSCSGRAEIVSASRRLALLVQAGTIAPRDIDDSQFGAALSTQFLPDPDLVIRTGGRYRLDNVLLWELAYAEMIFVDKLWPDFTGEDLATAILEFRRRDRRFGAIVPNGLADAAIQPFGSDS